MRRDGLTTHLPYVTFQLVCLMISHRIVKATKTDSEKENKKIYLGHYVEVILRNFCAVF